MSFSESGGIITQSGRDTDLSGLTGVTGVTTKTENGITIYEVADTHRIKVEGTLFHDPDIEVLILRHDNQAGDTDAIYVHYDPGATWTNLANSDVEHDSDGRLVVTSTAHGLQVGDAVMYQGYDSDIYHNNVFPVYAATTDTFTLGHTEFISGLPSTSLNTSNSKHRYKQVASYNYGKEITQYGKTSLSKGCGLLITGNRGANDYDENGAGLAIGTYGMLIARGGVITSSRPLQAGYLDIEGTTYVSTTETTTRSISGGVINNFTLVDHEIAGVNGKRVFKSGFTLNNAAMIEIFSAGFYEVILRDFDSSSNPRGIDIGHYSDARFPHRDWIIINSVLGSSVRGLGRNENGTAAKGNVFVKKEVSFNLKDTEGNPLQGVKMYMEDKPTPNYAKDVVFPAPTLSGFEYTRGDGHLDIGNNTQGVYNSSNDTVSYDYTNPITYSSTTDANGKIDTLQVTTGVQIIEHHSNDDATIATKYGITTNSNGVWQASSTDPTTPSYDAWDTTDFGGFYKVDRRGIYNDATDQFTFKFFSYNHSFSSSTQALKGLGELAVNWVLFDDQLITEPNKANVDAYQEIDTPQKFYNRAKSYLVDNYAGETSTIVSREGNSIDAGSYNVVIDGNVTDAASAFAISGNTLTIKATRFVGNITTTGTTTLSNDAEVIGTFGSTTVLPWEVKNVEATTRLQLYNLTKDALVVTQKLSGTAGTYVDATGTYDQTEISVGDVIRLRCTCVVGAEAMLPVEITGVATSTGITFSVDQVADEVYNSNAIDGSQVSTLTADYTNPMGVDISDADGTASVKEIYAFFVYSTTTEDGVDLWFGGMRAIDNANYEVVTANADIKIQNIGSNAVVVTDGRMYRDDGTSILYAEDGDKPIVMDSGALVTSIQPQVEAGLNANAKVAGIDKNSKLIPALL